MPDVVRTNRILICSATIHSDMDELPNWTVETLDDDDNPIGWRNQNTHTFVGIRYNDELDAWEVSGENSRIATADSVEEARERAHEFMVDTPRPSSMV